MNNSSPHTQQWSVEIIVYRVTDPHTDEAEYDIEEELDVKWFDNQHDAILYASYLKATAEKR